jgi:hypothetical protein
LTVGATGATGDITIKSNDTTARSLTLEDSITIKPLTANHVLFANADDTISSEAQLAVSRGGTGIGTYTKGDILYSDATNSLAKLGIGSAGQALRVVDGVPVWTTGGSVDQTLVLKFGGGTTEGTSLYTYDGSAQKTVDFIGGNLITITAASGSVTFDHDDVTRTDDTSEASPGFAATFDVIDSVDTDDSGHVTAVNVKTVTLPTETQLSDVDAGTGTWLTDITVNDHEITLSRSNTTTATITVGELIITKAEEPAQTGNLTVGGNAVIAGNLTVSGTVTTINTETIALADNIIELNSNIGEVEPTQNAGIEINRGTETNYQFLFDETTDEFKIGEIGGLQPVLTRDEVANLEESDILVWNSTAGKAVGKTFDELALPNKYAASIGDGTATTYTITHNLNTTDITYSVKEIATGEIVFTNVTVTGVNTISVSFAVAPTSNQYRVVVIG